MFDVLSSCDNGFTCMLEFKINGQEKAINVLSC